MSWAMKRSSTKPKSVRRKHAVGSEPTSSISICSSSSGNDDAVNLFLAAQNSKRAAAGELFLPSEASADVAENFHHSVRFLSVLFRYTGSLPVFSTDRGWTFKLRSPMFAYSFVLYTATFALFVAVLSELLSRLHSSATRDEFNAHIHNQLFIGMLLLYMTLPLTTWQDASTFAAYLNNWDAFQTLFLEVTRTRLRFADTHRRQTAVLLASILFAVVCSLLFSPLPRDWRLLPNIVNVVFITMGNYYWVLSCDAVVGAGRQLKARFREDANRSAFNGAHTALHQYRHLWLSLARLGEDTASSVCRTYGTQLVLGLYLITISLYGLLATAIDARRDNVRLAQYVAATAITITPCYLLCDKGFAVAQEVKNGMKEELQRMNTLILDRRAMHEMSLFFQCIYNNHPVLSLGGFFTVDRALFKSAGATICTYLIVILQFQLSLKQNDASTVDSKMADNTTSAILD